MIHLFWPSTSCWQCWTNSTGETFQESLEQERCLQLQWKLQLSEEASGRLLRARDLSWTGRIYGLVCFYWKHLETRVFFYGFYLQLYSFNMLKNREKRDEIWWSLRNQFSEWKNMKIATMKFRVFSQNGVPPCFFWSQVLNSSLETSQFPCSTSNPQAWEYGGFCKWGYP